MVKVKFKGKSDSDFINGNIYILINMKVERFVWAFLTNEQSGISSIPYNNIDLFNENWEVIEEERQ